MDTRADPIRNRKSRDLHAATSGRVVHSYNDHASLAKFIEANWSLPPVTSRSRDNLAQPTASPNNPYVPINPPAIGDLMDLFDFHSGQP
jgi:phospholipase C